MVLRRDGPQHAGIGGLETDGVSHQPAIADEELHGIDQVPAVGAAVADVQLLHRVAVAAPSLANRDLPHRGEHSRRQDVVVGPLVPVEARHLDRPPLVVVGRGRLEGAGLDIGCREQVDDRHRIERQGRLEIELAVQLIERQQVLAGLIRRPLPQVFRRWQRAIKEIPPGEAPLRRGQERWGVDLLC